MRELSYYLSLWKLSQPELLTETHSSKIFLVQNQDGHKSVLKQLKPAGHEEAGGANLLAWYAGGGTVKIMVNDDEAHLLEYLPGPTLKTVVGQGQDQKATEIIVEVVEQLFKPRSTPIPADLIPLKTRFRQLFKKAEEDQKSGQKSVFIHAAAITEKLLSTQASAIPLHGDMHHENILYSDRGWLAIDPKGVLGDPCYEFGNIFCNPQQMPSLVHDVRRVKELARIFSHKFDLDSLRILQFAFSHACLSAAWSISDGEDASYATKVSELIYPLINTTAGPI